MSERTLYTAEATVTGGRKEGHGRTSDGELEVDLRSPKELGGEGGGTNPEQLFAIGFASCFESAMQTVARRMKMETGPITIDSKVHLHPTEDRRFKLGVEFDVSMPEADPEQGKQLVSFSHQVCPYSNATRGNIDVAIRLNGEPLE